MKNPITAINKTPLHHYTHIKQNQFWSKLVNDNSMKLFLKTNPYYMCPNIINISRGFSGLSDRAWKNKSAGKDRDVVIELTSFACTCTCIYLIIFFLINLKSFTLFHI